MKLTSATGKVTVFNGNDKTEAPLALAGDKLEAKGSFKVGARHQGAGRRGAQRQARGRGAVHAEVRSCTSDVFDGADELCQAPGRASAAQADRGPTAFHPHAK